jgi:CubicO group peptidase (beta-lactamase class C family)
MKYTTTLALLFLLLSAVNLSANDKPITNTINEKIESTLSEFPSNTQLSIAILKNGKADFIGFENKNGKIVKVDNSKKVFEIGSISKVFTSVLLANLVSEGKIDLEDKVSKYFKVNPELLGKIKIKHLANHTSGLPRMPTNYMFHISDPNNPYKDYNEEHLMEFLELFKELESIPSENYQYSNLGTGLLGLILTKVSSETYEDLLQEYIFKPLKIDRAYQPGNFIHKKTEKCSTERKNNHGMF